MTSDPILNTKTDIAAFPSSSDKRQTVAHWRHSSVMATRLFSLVSTILTLRTTVTRRGGHLSINLGDGMASKEFSPDASDASGQKGRTFRC